MGYKTDDYNEEILYYEKACEPECCDGEMSEPDVKYYLQIL